LFLTARYQNINLTYSVGSPITEIGFFDFYIIPLAKRMKEVGVFGRTADECLAFAERNREEWRVNGPEAVEKMIQRIVGPL
jgi:hypothetical protein